MKFIIVHGVDSRKYWINPAKILYIEKTEIPKAPLIRSYIWFHDCNGKSCIETPEEILQKIAEAEQRHERSFMDDWKREIDDRMSKLTVRKDGDADATDRC